jgi:hypothetical protein
MIYRRFVSRPTLGLILLAVIVSPLVGDLLGIQHAFATLVDPHGGPLRITSPTDASSVGDGDLVLIEGTAIDPSDGDADRVEVAIGDTGAWAPAESDASEVGRWRYLWADPAPGVYRVRVRSLADNGATRAEQSINVQVDNTWSSPFIVDNPYATPGTYRKGQMHMHSTGSFDGWNSMQPAAYALEYKRRGYSFVVITDHDTVSYPSEVNDGTFIAIPGFESTSEKGHITASFTTKAISPDQPVQARLDAIGKNGGLAILAHPDWEVGWTIANFRDLHGFFAFEIFNGVTTTDVNREKRNAELWQATSNAKGWSKRLWAVAVDDAHTPDQIDKGWVMVKTSNLNEGEIRRSLERGAFYASNGPSFGTLGVLNGSIVASSPEAVTIRFINQDGVVVDESPAAWADYQPTGAERWVRVEAIARDGRMAWSQPFWLLPNTPKLTLAPLWGGQVALIGQTLPGAHVAVYDGGRYLGDVDANQRGEFIYRLPPSGDAAHEFSVVAQGPWPDRLESPRAVLSNSQSARS